MSKQLQIRNSTAEFLIFQAEARRKACRCSTKMRPSGLRKKR